jgi:hypothetical protein
MNPNHPSVVVPQPTYSKANRADRRRRLRGKKRSLRNKKGKIQLGTFGSNPILRALKARRIEVKARNKARREAERKLREKLPKA